MSSHSQRKAIATSQAPEAIGTYSQAIQVGETFYLSGQIAIPPFGQVLIDGDFRAQLRRVLFNIKAICEASGGDLDEIAKLTLYITNFENYPIINEEMPQFFNAPYPARAVVGVAELPQQALVEIDAIMVRQALRTKV